MSRFVRHRATPDFGDRDRLLRYPRNIDRLSKTMTDTAQLRQQLNDELDRLSPENLVRLLQFARQLRQIEESNDL